MSRWKSRWSCDRLVNAATAKRVPLTRPIASEWLDTSIATSVTPSSAITANSACRSGASGVVSALGSTRPATRVPMVPTSPAVRPAAASPASIRCAVVVLPLVPVTPSTDRCAVGSPCTSAAAAPSTSRGRGCTSSGASARAGLRAPSGSVSTATAPAASAPAA
jgi:hypothetical protein